MPPSKQLCRPMGKGRGGGVEFSGGEIREDEIGETGKRLGVLGVVSTAQKSEAVLFLCFG